MKYCTCIITLLLIHNTSFSQDDKCNLNELPSVRFRGRTSKIGKMDSATLVKVSELIKQSPECSIRVSGNGEQSKSGTQISWDRVHAVIRFLVEKRGLSPDRLIFEYGMQGDPNTVDLIPTQEKGPSSIPAPHPNLRPRPRL